MIFRNILFLGLLSVSALSAESVLKEISHVPIAVPEPSSMSFEKDAEGKVNLWVVSDKTGNIYRLNENGKLLSIIELDPGDRESLCTDDSGFFYTVDEKTSELMKIDRTKGIVGKHTLPVKSEKNHGVEGIAWCPERDSFFVVKEKKPLLVELDKAFNCIKTYNKNFAKDFSDIFYDRYNKCFWIISHESSCVFVWTPERGRLDSYSFKVLQAEGFAVDFEKGFIFIISDKDNMLYKFELPYKYMITVGKSK